MSELSAVWKYFCLGNIFLFAGSLQASPSIQAKSLNAQSDPLLSCIQNTAYQIDQLTQNSLSLTQAVERALCYNPATRQNWIQIKIRATQLKSSYADYYPNINATTGYDYTNSKTKVKSSQMPSSDNKSRSLNTALNVSWLIFDFGQRNATVKQAEAMLQMALAQQEQQMQALMLQTIVAYYEIMRLHLLYDSQKTVVEDAEQNYAVAKARYKAGAAIKADQLQMQANWVKARADQTQLKGQISVAMGRLASLMGSPVDTEYKILSMSQMPESIELKPIQALIDQALIEHPRLKESQANIDADRQNIRAITSERYPQLSLQSSYSRQGVTGQESYNQVNNQAQISLQLTLPIFDGFRRKHRLTEAEQNLALRMVEQDQIKYDLLINIWDKYYSLMAENENLQALKLLQASAEEANQVTVGRYKAGVGQMLEVLNAQRVLSEANMNYTSAVTQFMILKYELLSSLGQLRTDF